MDSSPRNEDELENNGLAQQAGGGGGGGGNSTSTGMMMMKMEREHMFDKVVTPSDVGKLNRLVIPKQHAERYFPLDSSTNDKGLLLNFEDRNGKRWRFRHSYWNRSQTYVMTKGWSRFVKEKKLDAGDIVSFQRGVGELGKDRLFIDWRRRPDAPDSNLSLSLSLPLPHHHFSSYQRQAWSPLLVRPPLRDRLHIPQPQQLPPPESVTNSDWSGTAESFVTEEGSIQNIDLNVTMTSSYSGEETNSESEDNGTEVSQTSQPEGIQVEEMQTEATPLKPQGEAFTSGQMEFQIEDVGMESEASEQHGLILMQGGLGLTKPPKDEDWKNAKEIYLMDNELTVLPENPRCPKLSALFLQRNYKLRTIPTSFFYHMRALQTLNFSRTGIKFLPDSIVRLVGLKRLFLNDCHRFMRLSPKVGELKQLEVLDLEGTEIMDLPQEIEKLTNLTCLEISFYGYTSDGRRAMGSNAVVPCGVISALSRLEELNINVNPDDERWDANVEAIVNEVYTLNRLETLKFYFPRVELLRHIQRNIPSLLHFRFTVGRHAKRIISRVPLDVEFELERWERCLKYINGVGVPREIKKVLQCATAFFLDRHSTVKKLSNFGIQNMENLKCLVMGECNEVQVIIDEEDDCNEIVSESYGTEKIVLGSLEYMYIYYMKSLRSIWARSVHQNSLFHLKSLALRTCPQLTTIFTQGLLANLCNLEELKVEDCPSINSIVSCKISAEHKTSFFLPNLKKISLHYMPGLVSISSGLHIAPKLEWLSFYNCPKLKNPFIEEVSSQDLKKIKGERSWWEALEWRNGHPGFLDEIFVPIHILDC